MAIHNTFRFQLAGVVALGENPCLVVEASFVVMSVNGIASQVYSAATQAQSNQARVFTVPVCPDDVNHRFVKSAWLDTHP